MNLALNNLQWLIYLNTKAKQTKPNAFTLQHYHLYIYIHFFFLRL